MSSFKNKPKAKSNYPGILSRAEELRQAPPKKFQPPKFQNPQVKSHVAKNLQRSFGRLGK